MSGIYIPNWEKPKSCDDCWAEYAYEICNSHSDSCPLIEVPDHGRLIDADALKEKMKIVTKTVVQEIVEYDINAYKVDNAPTIIPADKGGDSDV